MDQSAEHAHVGGTTRTFLLVWFWLLAFTGLEVFLGYEQLALKLMIVLLMGISIAKAALIISYFMHLKYERRSLALTLMPALVLVIVLMFLVFPDSLQVLHMQMQSH
jgi:cytochrome c oxidase subunit IV